MVNRNILIGVSILVLVVLIVVSFSAITGNVITGSAIGDEEIENEYFKIDDINEETEENLNDSQNNSGQG